MNEWMNEWTNEWKEVNELWMNKQSKSNGRRTAVDSMSNRSRIEVESKSFL